MKDLEAIKAPSWASVKSLDQAIKTVEFGAILMPSEGANLKKQLSTADQSEFLKYLATRLVDSRDNRLKSELIVETLFSFLASFSDEKQIHIFLRSYFALPNCDNSCWDFIDITLSSEFTLSENTESSNLFATAVLLISELGISVCEYDKVNPKNFRNAQNLLTKIATHFLSLSNTNNNRIRLTILHYFATLVELNNENKDYLDRVIFRFGHTAFELLFDLLFNKKSEAVAYEFLLNNMPKFLKGNKDSQQIIQNTFKIYMLKHPDKFSIFVEELSNIVKTSSATDISYNNFFQHMMQLMIIASNLHHRKLFIAFVSSLINLREFNQFEQYISFLKNEITLKPVFKQIIIDIDTHKYNNKKVAQIISRLKETKRGRKPCFSKSAAKTNIIFQLYFIGEIEKELYKKAS